jgi:hypothetical protein
MILIFCFIYLPLVLDFRRYNIHLMLAFGFRYVICKKRNAPDIDLVVAQFFQYFF